MNKEADFVGLGASAVSRIDGDYFKVVTNTDAYQNAIMGQMLAIGRGYLASDRERMTAHVVQSLLCQEKVCKRRWEEVFVHDFETFFAKERAVLTPFIESGYVVEDKSMLSVTSVGRTMIDQIARCFLLAARPSETALH